MAFRIVPCRFGIRHGIGRLMFNIRQGVRPYTSLQTRAGSRGAPREKPFRVGGKAFEVCRGAVGRRDKLTRALDAERPRHDVFAHPQHGVARAGQRVLRDRMDRKEREAGSPRGASHAARQEAWRGSEVRCGQIFFLDSSSIEPYLQIQFQCVSVCRYVLRQSQRPRISEIHCRTIADASGMAYTRLAPSRQVVRPPRNTGLAMTLALSR